VKSQQTNAQRAAPVQSRVAVGLLQRQCACGSHSISGGQCEACRKHGSQPPLERTRTRSDPVPTIVHDVLSSPGQPLDFPTRAFFEPRFGRDFSAVRIHADPRAAASAAALRARAYTVANDVVFGDGHYAPDGTPGRGLLAHELAHVVQQTQGRDARARVTAISTPGDAGELEADSAARRIMSGETIALRHRANRGIVQRQDVDAPADVTPADKPAEKPLSRPEEIQLSRTSPGEITGTANPPTISLFNFAIDSAALKSKHRALIAELADILKGPGSENITILVTGHADASGEPVVNTPLSKHRAEAVQKELQAMGGPKVSIAWFGEDRPVDTNETVAGRTRNRRVDIFILPKPIDGKKDDKKDDDDGDKDDDHKDDDKKKKDDDDDGGDETTFCERHPIICKCKEHPIICALIAGLILAILFCLKFPLRCLPSWDGDGKKKPKKKEKKEEKKKKACITPDDVKLPSGELKMTPLGIFHHVAFNMGLTFTESDECACNAGEYRQNVKGFFRRDWGKGPSEFKNRPHPLTPGHKLEPDKFNEDGNPAHHPEAYGHRYLDDSARALPPAGRMPLVASNIDHDSFLPGREHGCTYAGTDNPGLETLDMYEHVHIKLDFEGGPVDVSDWPVETRLPGWSTWWIDFENTPPTRPPPTPKPKPTKGGGGGPGPGPGGPGPAPGPGGAPARKTTPRPYGGPSGGERQLAFLGGISGMPVVGMIYTITLGFQSQGQDFFTTIDVEVTKVDEASDTFEVTTTNTVTLNVAPEGHPVIVIKPHTKAWWAISHVKDR
jgi:outer membrane protein OmpA-like peptidoglycan-associated protein